MDVLWKTLFAVVLLVNSCFATFSSTTTVTRIRDSEVATEAFTPTSILDRVKTAASSSYLCNRRVVPPPSEVSRCCSRYQEYYSLNWHSSGLYLTDFLTTLEFWNCTDLYSIACVKRTFNFSDFTELVYDHFCDPSRVEAKCYNKLLEVVNFNVEGDSGSGAPLWKDIVRSVDPSDLSSDLLKEPCVGIAQFIKPTGGVGRFHELIEPILPFCDIVWMGYDINSAMSGMAYVWPSLASGCQASIVICMTIAAIFGLAVTMSNVTVITVYARHKKLRNSQGIYKMSIAVGDLIVGVLVFPAMIVFQYWTLFSPRRMGSLIPTGNNETSTYLEKRKPWTGKEFLNVGLVMSVGFFTMSSILVSVYSLLAASVDRFLAVYRPLKYDKKIARRRAKYWSIGVWPFAIILAILPVFIGDIEYALIASTMVIPVSETALVFLAIVFLLPLIVVWGLNLATFKSAMKHAKNRRKITTSRSTDKMELQMAKTIGLMVGVFTACTLPIIVLFILPLALSNIHLPRPGSLDPYSTKVYNSIEYCMTFVLLSNSLWNCVIYSIRAKEFREAAKNMYGAIAKVLRIDQLCLRVRNVASAAILSNNVTSDTPKSTKSTDTHKGERTSPEQTVSSSARDGGQSDQASKFDKVVASTQDIVPEEPSFSSFAIDAGADRFFMSVMDQIDEAINPDIQEG